MSRPIDRLTSPDINQVLGYDGFIAKCRPKNRHGKAIIGTKRCQKTFNVYIADFKAGYGTKIIVAIGSQKPPHTQEVAGYMEINNLPRSVAQ